MLRAKLYRPPQLGETPPPGAVRVRLPVERPADPTRHKAGYRCRSPVCAVTLVLVETDFDRFATPYGRRADIEHLNCPCCGFRFEFVGYYEMAHLVPAEA
jgi:hypothetical protein